MNNISSLGGSLGLVVMGGDDSCLRGCGFKYDIFTLIYSKNFIVCLKIPKRNKKRPGRPI